MNANDRLRLPRNRPLADRFWSFVVMGDGCWEWQGKIGTDGYGRFKVKDKTVRANRMAYMLSVGEIPAGLFVCHRCDNRKCVRPDHLFVGTASENTRDAVRKGRWWQVPPRNPKGRPRATHCKRGHEYNAANTAPSRKPSRPNGRRCRLCEHIRYREQKARRAQEVEA